MKTCIFCTIVQHKIPANIVYEDNMIMAILDTDPITDGHTLIIPKKNIRDIHSLDKITGTKMMNVARMLAGAIQKAFKFDGIMIMQVNGAFQDVPHFHMHIFGRNKKQDINIKYPSGISRTAAHLTRNLARLKTALTQENK